VGDDPGRVGAMQTIEEVKRQMRDLRQILDDIEVVLGETQAGGGAAPTVAPEEIGTLIRQLELLRSRLERLAAGPAPESG